MQLNTECMHSCSATCQNEGKSGEYCTFPKSFLLPLIFVFSCMYIEFCNREIQSNLPDNLGGRNQICFHDPSADESLHGFGNWPVYNYCPVALTLTRTKCFEWLGMAQILARHSTSLTRLVQGLAVDQFDNKNPNVKLLFPDYSSAFNKTIKWSYSGTLGSATGFWRFWPPGLNQLELVKTFPPPWHCSFSGECAHSPAHPWLCGQVQHQLYFH